MRVKQICYHLDRARHFRELADRPRPPGRSGYMRRGQALERAADHDRRAAELFADGIRRYKPPVQTAAARRTRAWRRAQPKGPGRGRFGQLWGRHEK